MKKLEFLVIHCTATPACREVTSAEIRHWHMDPVPKGRGWSQVGYRTMYHINGGVEQLVANNEDGFVDAWEITNGVANKNSICQHIVYVGGMTADNKKPFDSRSLQQKEAMKRDILAFHKKFPNIRIVGHNYFDKGKACPSFDVTGWLKQIGINQKL